MITPWKLRKRNGAPLTDAREWGTYLVAPLPHLDAF